MLGPGQGMVVIKGGTAQPRALIELPTHTADGKRPVMADDHDSHRAATYSRLGKAAGFEAYDLEAIPE